MTPGEVFAWGFLGSAAVEMVTLLGLYSGRALRLPPRYRKVGFWITRTVLAVVAGLLAVAYEIDQRILAFNVGAATPLIVTFMARGLKRPLPKASLAETVDKLPHAPAEEATPEKNPSVRG